MKNYSNFVFMLALILFLSNNFLAQAQGLPPGPCEFSETETICITNSSNFTFDGIPLSSFPGCDYEVCVKVKPKVGCVINCEMLLNPNGNWIETCYSPLTVGETHCFTIPVPYHPMTNCFEVELTMKVVGHTPTMIEDLETDFAFIGAYRNLNDNCVTTWNTALIRITGSGDFNFNIISWKLTGQ